MSGTWRAVSAGRRGPASDDGPRRARRDRGHDAVAPGGGAPPYSEGARRQFALGRSVSSAVLVVRNEVPGWDTVGAFDARLARASGYAGYVCDGPIRDTDTIAALGFPVWATAVRADCIRLADLPAGTSIAFEFGEVVDVAGMSVEPGMAIVADGDGVGAFLPHRLTEVVDAAERLVEREARLIARLKAGATVAEMLSPTDEV